MRGLLLALCAVLLYGLTLSAQSSSEDVFEVTVEASVKGQKRSEAEKEIFNQAVRQATKEKLLDIIGKVKVDKFDSVIERKIIRESGKYVSYMKGGKLTFDGTYYRMPVTLRLSMVNLHTLLSEAGLTYQKEGAPKALPLISFVDRIHGQSYYWWIHQGDAGKTFLRRQAEGLYSGLQKAFWNSGFYAVRPVVARIGNIMPHPLQQQTFRAGDYELLGDYFQVQVLLLGEFLILPSQQLADGARIMARISAVHAITGRVIGEVTRSMETDSGHFEEVVGTKFADIFESLSDDLAVQVLQTWQRGVLGANLLNLAVKGTLTPQNVEALKTEMARQVSAIKTVRERLFEQGVTTFEVDSSQTITELTQTLRRIQIAKFPFRVIGASEQNETITLELQ